MKPIPLPLLTLYADLVQQLEASTDRSATISRQILAGREYLRAIYRVGKTQRSIHLGPADDPDVVAKADAMAREQALAKERRTIVSSLRRSIPGPSGQLGTVLEVIADAGLFRPTDGALGAVLVGAAAFQTYSAALGKVLPGAQLVTADVDLATAHLALAPDDRGHPDDHGDDDGEPRKRGRPAERPTMEQILKRADSTFSGLLQLNTRDPPSRFRAANGFMVDLLTPTDSRDDRNPMPLPGLKAGAVPLQYLKWLITDPLPAAVLHGSGILVTVPDPARYAIHKLIVAKVRNATSGKQMKDLAQAKALMEAIGDWDQRIGDLIDDAKSNGPKWERAIVESLAQIRSRA